MFMLGTMSIALCQVERENLLKETKNTNEVVDQDVTFLEPMLPSKRREELWLLGRERERERRNEPFDK